VHFKDGQPSIENPDPTERTWDTTLAPKLWEESERTHWIGPKLSQEIPNHSDTCLSENTATAPETTTNSGNCNTAPEAEFFVNNRWPDKDLRIQELQEQQKKAEKELKILKN